MEIDEEDTIKTLLQSLVVKMDLQADRSAALESRLSILEGERTLDKDDERDDGSHVSAKETRQWLMKKLATIEREGYPKVLKRDQTRA